MSTNSHVPNLIKTSWSNPTLLNLALFFDQAADASAGQAARVLLRSGPRRHTIEFSPDDQEDRTVTYAEEMATSYAEQATNLAAEELEPRDRALVYAVSALAYAVQAIGEKIAGGLSEISLELMPGAPRRRP